MIDQNQVSKTACENRGFCSEQEAVFEMNAHTPINQEARLQLAGQTGQVLVALGSLLGDRSLVDTGYTSRTGRKLVELGRKLIATAECCSRF